MLAIIGIELIGDPFVYSILLSSFLLGDILGNWLQNKVSWSWKKKYILGIAFTGISCMTPGGANWIIGVLAITNYGIYILSISLLTGVIGITEPFFKIPTSSLIQSSVEDDLTSSHG